MVRRQQPLGETLERCFVGGLQSLHDGLVPSPEPQLELPSDDSDSTTEHALLAPSFEAFLARPLCHRWAPASSGIGRSVGPPARACVFSWVGRAKHCLGRIVSVSV